MDYEATDRYMSGWLVSCIHNGTRFYLTDENTASDIKGRAHYFRYYQEADSAAHTARAEYAWAGFHWTARRVAAS